LIAVLDRHAGVNLAHDDVFVNVVGGLRLQETASDLAVAAALISSESNTEINSKACFFGEVGLTGEVRAVPFVDLRLKEAAHLGFEQFVVPYSNKKHLEEFDPTLVQKITWVREVQDLAKILPQRPSAKSPTPKSKKPSGHVEL
jgi:DNA repair protein RadA/Sms